jgi:N-acetylglucosaminyldiphosphoundecaprenol N-acetyl-beta-D-mannosaminyltransferase
MAQTDIVNLFGYRISNGGMSEDIKLASQALLGRSRPFFVACANPHSLVVASRDGEFRDALQDADLLLPDGSGLILAARILKLPLRQKVAGFDFFFNFCNYAAGESREIRFFFLGAAPFVLERIVARLRVDFPSINVAGTYSPPFKDVYTADDTADMIEAINKSAADVLWVGMTAPKQEKWIWRNRDKLNVRLAAAVGAVFDFYAGTKKRTSEFWLKHGLEWLPRLLKEPRRLWARNFKSTPIFLSWVARERLRQIARKSQY